MLDFSPEKMLFIFLIVAVVLGPEKLPELSRKIGRAVGELRKLSGGFREEMNKAVNDMTTESKGNDKPSSGGSEISTGSPAAGKSDDTPGS
ncbi:MAG TPA: twin-arginine translocase TatA/TatE family subunit [Acidimicrobiales bacterium]|nr:twin-arginine translocase TatA/TatE family subunit [Acidimicrobiales bacterium]